MSNKEPRPVKLLRALIRDICKLPDAPKLQSVREVLDFLEELDEPPAVTVPREEFNQVVSERALELVRRVANLNRDAGEIGAGMLVQLVDEARAVIGEPPTVSSEPRVALRVQLADGSAQWFTTGKTGPNWITKDRAKAFVGYTLAEARDEAARLNKYATGIAYAAEGDPFPEPVDRSAPIIRELPARDSNGN